MFSKTYVDMLSGREKRLQINYFERYWTYSKSNKKKIGQNHFEEINEMTLARKLVGGGGETRVM